MPLAADRLNNSLLISIPAFNPDCSQEPSTNNILLVVNRCLIANNTCASGSTKVFLALSLEGNSITTSL